MSFFEYLNHEINRSIPIYSMRENNNGDLPFNIRKYTVPPGGVPLHCHEFMQINYVVGGAGQHKLNENAFPIHAGDVFVIPPYVPHEIFANEHDSPELFELEFNTEFIVNYSDTDTDPGTYFDFAYLEPFLVSESQVKPRLSLTGSFQRSIEAMMNEALAEYQTQKKGYDLVIKSLLLHILVLLGREFSRKIEENRGIKDTYSAHHSRMAEAIAYLEQHSHLPVRLEDVARRCSYSPSHFGYLFRSYTSKSFVKYLQHLRISQAKELLLHTDSRALDIAFQVGFNNITSFNKTFRSVTGMTPLEYRRGNRAE